MEAGYWFFLVSGLWGVAMVATLIDATRICYAIEKRSGTKPARSGLPAFANVVPVALNIGVAADAETQAMRRRMNMRLLVILGGFVAFWTFLRIAGPA